MTGFEVFSSFQHTRFSTIPLFSTINWPVEITRAPKRRPVRDCVSKRTGDVVISISDNGLP